MKFMSNRWIFFLLAVIVTIIQFSLLWITLDFGFTQEDWWMLFDYQVTGYGLSFLEKYFKIFHNAGLYHTYQIVYLGVLESLLKGNYSAYQITTISFKILATISLYPLILAVFKRRLLAFLTTILYAISYSSAGAFFFIVLGSDYLAIFFMNVFLLCYYYYFASGRNLFIYVATILLFFSFILSPIRMYPLFVIIIFIEFSAWIRSKQRSGYLFFISRLSIIFFPFLMIILFFPSSTGSQLETVSILYNLIAFGNYHLLLSPFAGLGYTFLTNDYWSVFGPKTFNGFNNYMLFLFNGPVIIYSFLAILIGFVITKKPWRMILSIITINSTFQIVCYLLITNLKGQTGPNIKYFNQVSIYAIFLGFFVISIAFASGWLWFRKRLNLLLLASFLGPIFSIVFLWGLWFIKGDVLNFREGIHWYLVIAPIGSSLFLAAIMTIIYDKLKNSFDRNFRNTLTILLFLTIIPIYLISKKEINSTFGYLLSTGYRAADQEQMKNTLLVPFEYSSEKASGLFYIEALNQTYFPISLIVGFEQALHFQNWKIINGCIGLIKDRNMLEKSATIQNNVKGFNANSLCVDMPEVSRSEVFYEPENFYAFELKNRETINIKERVLKELGF